jgi:AraC-like DNA-binding protein
MPLVVALVSDREACARIRSSLHGNASVDFCRGRAELVRRVASLPTGVVITELWDASGAPTAIVVEHLRARFPAIPVVAYCTLCHTTSRELLAMARAGVNGFVLRGIDDVGDALRVALAAADDNCFELAMSRELATVLAADVQPVVAHCLSHARCAYTVTAAAAALGVSRRTLFNRLANAGLPSPSAVISWCRLLLAARLLEDPERSVESIALALEFGSAAALRGMLRRYTGVLPNDVRRRGGAAYVLESLRCELKRGRQRVALCTRSPEPV